MLSRRSLLAGAAAAALASRTQAGAAASVPLASITRDALPITAGDYRQRVARLQVALAAQGIKALLLESGSSLAYFTGIRWHRSERTTAALIPAIGKTLVVTPAFEAPSIRETLQVAADVRAWDEHESPFPLLAQGLHDAGAPGLVAVEPTVRFFIVDGVSRSAAADKFVPGGDLVRACRLLKSAAELALMQTANDVTIAALRWVHRRVGTGMQAGEIASLMNDATLALGGTPEFSLVLLNEASAYPHGSLQPQTVRDGSVILMDCGCTVQGYQSDISRTWIHGKASGRQRTVWDTVKRGQEIALETAKVGVTAGAVDDAVRSYYEHQGWGPGYRLPGLPHRTGHGIGLDGHEDAYLVHGDATPLQPGMCFSDEPGIYIPGEFGVRLEDCWHMTADGPQTFTPLARSLDDPI